MVRLKEVRCKLKHHVMLQKLYNRSVFFLFFVLLFCFVFFFLLYPYAVTDYNSTFEEGTNVQRSK